MADASLLTYIRQARAAGQTDSQIQTVLVHDGWPLQQITAAFDEINGVPKPVQSAQPVAAAAARPASFKKPHTLVKIILAIVVLLVICGGVGIGLLYAKVYDPVWNPFRPNPESVILKAWNTMLSEKMTSGSFDASLSVTGNSTIAGAAENFNVKASSSGSFDSSNANNKMVSEKASFNASATSPQSQPYNVSAMIESVLAGKELYVKVDNLDAGSLGGLLSMFGANPATITGKWYEINLTEANATQTATQYVGMVNPLVGQQISTQSSAASTADEAVYEQTAKQVVQIMIDKRVYDLQQLDDVQGTDGKEYHYSLSINRQRLDSALPAIYQALLNGEQQLETGQTSQSVPDEKAFAADVDGFLDKAGQPSVGLFISQQGNALDEVQISDNINLGNISPSSPGNLSIVVTGSQSGLNKPVNITVPTGAQDLSSWFQMNAINGDLQQIAETDANEISWAAGGDGTSNFTALCSKGVVNVANKAAGANLESVGLNLKSASDDIVAEGGSEPVCFASAKSFCVSTELTDGTFACVGPNMVLGKTRCTSALTACK